MYTDLERKLCTTLQNAINKKELSGANILVVKNGKELCYLEDGYADIEKKKKIDRDTIFRLYSMTKPVTAVAAMILVERGELCLQSPVGEYLPSFQNMQVYQKGQLEAAVRPVNVHDLLNMTSGLSYGDGESETEKNTGELLSEAERSLSAKYPMTTQQFAEKAGKIPLLFHPGTSWKYGISADIMGAVIEKVSGKPFGEFLGDEIIKPLGMLNTDFYVPDQKREHLAKVYETGEDGELQEYSSSYLGIRNSMDRKAAYESGGAGLVSTIDDYEKFARMLLQKGSFGNNRILQPNTVEYLTMGKLTEKQQSQFGFWFGQNGFSYGNYMRVLWNPWQAATLGKPMEYCWDGWLGCYFVNCPKEELTFLVMQQKKDSGKLVARLRNILFSMI